MLTSYAVALTVWHAGSRKQNGHPTRGRTLIARFRMCQGPDHLGKESALLSNGRSAGTRGGLGIASSTLLRATTGPGSNTESYHFAFAVHGSYTTRSQRLR